MCFDRKFISVQGISVVSVWYLHRLFSNGKFARFSLCIMSHDDHVMITWRSRDFTRTEAPLFDLCMFYDTFWDIILMYILMFFFDMFSGDIFTIKTLFTNGTLKSCEIQMSVIMTLQIFFIPKVFWRSIWFDY